jgi:hypothetical protein
MGTGKCFKQRNQIDNVIDLRDQSDISDNDDDNPKEKDTKLNGSASTDQGTGKIWRNKRRGRKNQLVRNDPTNVFKHGGKIVYREYKVISSKGIRPSLGISYERQRWLGAAKACKRSISDNFRPDLYIKQILKLAKQYQ